MYPGYVLSLHGVLVGGGSKVFTRRTRKQGKHRQTQPTPCALAVVRFRATPDPANHTQQEHPRAGKPAKHGEGAPARCVGAGATDPPLKCASTIVPSSSELPPSVVVVAGLVGPVLPTAVTALAAAAASEHGANSSKDNTSNIVALPRGAKTHLNHFFKSRGRRLRTSDTTSGLV